MKKFLMAAAAIITLCAFASCREEDKTIPTNYYSSKILGTWRLVSVESEPVPTNEQEILEFELYTLKMSVIDKADNGRMVFQYKESYSYEMNGANMSIFQGSTSADVQIESITENEMVLSAYTRRLPGGDKVLRNAVFKKVNSKYILLIDGLWEGASLTGEQTYGDANHRWEFFAFDQFLYMSQNSDGKWVPDVHPQGEYKTVADWLITHWSDDDGEHYECWEIAECSSNSMVLSALRKKSDGTRFETTLTMKRIR